MARAVMLGSAIAAIDDSCSVLCFVENNEEHSQAERAKCVDQRREQRYRRNQPARHIHHIENQIPHQESRHQRRSDDSEECRILQRHVLEYEPRRRAPQAVRAR